MAPKGCSMVKMHLIMINSCSETIPHGCLSDTPLSTECCVVSYLVEHRKQARVELQQVQTRAVVHKLGEVERNRLLSVLLLEHTSRSSNSIHLAGIVLAHVIIEINLNFFKIGNFVSIIDHGSQMYIVPTIQMYKGPTMSPNWRQNQLSQTPNWLIRTLSKLSEPYSCCQNSISHVSAPSTPSAPHPRPVDAPSTSRQRPIHPVSAPSMPCRHPIRPVSAHPPRQPPIHPDSAPSALSAPHPPRQPSIHPVSAPSTPRRCPIHAPSAPHPPRQCPIHPVSAPSTSRQRPAWPAGPSGSERQSAAAASRWRSWCTAAPDCWSRSTQSRRCRGCLHDRRPTLTLFSVIPSPRCLSVRTKHQGAVALPIGSVPRRTVFEWPQFDWLFINFSTTNENDVILGRFYVGPILPLVQWPPVTQRGWKITLIFC